MCHPASGCAFAPSSCSDGQCCVCGGGMPPEAARFPCELVCSNAACQQKGGNTVTCECIKDCNGRSCKYVGGVNPCRVNGVLLRGAKRIGGVGAPLYGQLRRLSNDMQGRKQGVHWQLL
eukprot:jgi/Mesvir1/26184/Mv04577-RA.1